MNERNRNTRTSVASASAPASPTPAGALGSAVLLAASAVLAAAALSCAQPPPAAAPARPAPKDASAENEWTPQSPQEKWWEAGAGACPEGAALVGALPPKGWVLECRSPDGKRNGRSSAWFPSGHAGTLVEYRNDVPHGRWLYWHNNFKLVEGTYQDGRRHGQWTYWFDRGSGFDATSRLQTHDPEVSVVETYDHGLLVKTVHLVDGRPVE